MGGAGEAPASPILEPLPKVLRIVVEGGDEWEPFVMTPSEGEPTGFAVELMKAVARAAGMESVVVKVGMGDTLEAVLERGDGDVAACVELTEQTVRTLDALDAFVTSPSVLVTRYHDGVVRTRGELEKKRVACVEGGAAERWLQDEGLAHESMRTAAELLRAVEEGRVEVALISQISAAYQSERLKIMGLRVTPFEERNQPWFYRSFGPALREGNVRLRETLVRASRSVRETGEFDKLYDRWLERHQAQGRSKVIGEKFVAPLEMGRRTEITRIVVGLDPATLPGPLLLAAEGTAPGGFAAELTRAVGEELGAAVEFRVLATEELRAQLLSGEIDAIACATVSDEDITRMDFSRPVFQSPGVLVVRKGAPQWATPGDVGQELIAASQGSFSHQWLATVGAAKVLPTASTEEAIKLVRDGTANGAVTAEFAARILIPAGERQLEIRPLPGGGYLLSQAFAVRTGNKNLLWDIEDAVSRLRESGKFDQIYDVWLKKVQPRERRAVVPWWTLIGVAGAGSLIGVGALAWVWSLRREVHKRGDALRQAEARFGAIAQNIPGYVCSYFVGDDGRRSRLVIGGADRGLMATVDDGALYMDPDAYVDRIHPDDREEYITKRNRSRVEACAVQHKYRVRMPDGAWRWIRSAGIPERKPGGVIWYWLVMDSDEEVRAREEVVREKEKYEAFVSQSAEGVWRCDLDEVIPTELPIEEQVDRMFRAGYLAECNDAMARMYGLSGATDLVGTRLERMLTPEEPANRAYLRRFAESGYRLVDAESREKDVNGREVYFSNTLTGIVENGKLVRAWGTQRDVTTQRAMRLAIEESERRHRAVSDHLPCVVYAYTVHDDGTRSSDYVSSGGSALQRAVAGVRLGQDWERFIALVHPEDRGRMEAAAAAARAGGGFYEAEYRLKFPDGEYRWVRSVASALRVPEGVRWYGLLLDVHANREETEARLASERRLQRLIDASPNVAIEGYDRAGRVVFWNSAAEKMFGYPESEALGRTLDKLILSPEAATAFQDAIRSLEAGGPTPAPSEWEFTSRDGRKGWAYSSLFALEVAGGEKLFVCMDVDVTDRVLGEEERRRLEEQVRQGQKMESLGMLAGGIAHDFNNILAAIRGNAGLAMEFSSGNAEVSQSLTAIDQAAQRGAELTRQLLSYAGKGRRTVEQVDLSALVREMGELIRVNVGKTATLRMELAGDLPPVLCDPTQMRQVVMNLLTNAAEAQHGTGGEVLLRTYGVRPGAAELSEFILPPAETGAPMVVIEVEDSGVGMSKETIRRMFEPFFTTKFTGRGLGLSVTMGIVKGHGGGIRVRSGEGKGTLFSVFLPVMREQEAVEVRTVFERQPRGGEVVGR
jgi:PAS domain S-box-containing protein